MAVTEQKVREIARREAKAVMMQYMPNPGKGKPYNLNRIPAPKGVSVWGVYDARGAYVGSVLKMGSSWLATAAGGPHLPKGHATHWKAADYLWDYVTKRSVAAAANPKKKEPRSKKLQKAAARAAATRRKKGTKKPTASVKITKLKSGPYSVTGKDKLGKPFRVRTTKKSTANAIKHLIDGGFTTAQLRKAAKEAKRLSKALGQFEKNPGKVWFPTKPAGTMKPRKKKEVVVKKKKAPKKNPPKPRKKKVVVKKKKAPKKKVVAKKKKKRSYTKVTRIFKQLVAKIKAKNSKVNLSSVGLEVGAGIHDTPRHFGRYYPSRKMVAVAPEIADQPDAVIRGVLLHELGHAIIDLGYAAKPKKRGYYALERRADVIAKAASGMTVYYDKNKLQRAGAGARGLKVRPKSLR